MNPELSAIKNPQVRAFYALGWGQHKILIDFYQLLAEESYDYRMVDTTERRSDSPRESLAHIIYVELVYFEAARTGVLEFKDIGVEHYKQFSKSQLLAELERVDQELYAFLTSESFDSQALVDVPWGGKMNVIDMLFFLKDHDILHIGWNLALMDHLKMPRFSSLIQYWG